MSLAVIKPTGSQVLNSADRDILIRNVTVIPMDRETSLAAHDVIVRKGRIISISATGQVKNQAQVQVIDGTGKFLMPGLAEMHAHVPPVDDIEPMKEVLTLFLAKGITTIRGMLGHSRHLELRQKINSGEITGPHFITSGPSFSGNSVKTPEEGADMVRKQKAAGYDFLKLHPGLTPATFAAISKQARESGIPFAGHVSYTVGVWRAIDAGYATIDHMDGFVESLVPGMDQVSEKDAGGFAMFVGYRADETRIPALMKALKEKQIWVVPTQCLFEKWFSPEPAEKYLVSPEMKYMSRETRENWANAKKNLLSNPAFNPEHIQKFMQLRRRLLLNCQQSGVGLLLGSDAPQVFDVPGFSAHEELAYYVAAGLSPYQALCTGTLNVGRFLGRSDIGVVKKDAVADLLLLNANPLADITATQSIAGVMLEGKWFGHDWIQESLRKLEKK